MSAIILQFRSKTEPNPITEMVLQQQAEIVRANDPPCVLDISSDAKGVLESLAQVLELNTRYFYEHFSLDRQETQALLKSYTQIIARLRLMIQGELDASCSRNR